MNNNLPEQKKEYFKYKPYPIVHQFDNDDKTGLSPAMEQIRKIIEETAIDDLNYTKFENFYRDGFIMADFTEIIDIEKGETAGFLFATFHKNTSTGARIRAKAFHAVKKEYRQSEKKYKRMELHKKYIAFYYKNLLFKEVLSKISTLKITSAIIQDIKNLPSDLIKHLNNKRVLEIKILAENPTTYKDVCNYAPDHETVPRDKNDNEWLKTATIKKLLVESTKLYNEYETKTKARPNHLVKTDFTVNTTKEEWCNYFKTTDIDKRFYLWQNFNCPDYAFEIVIPVNPKNIANQLIDSLESEIAPLIKIQISNLFAKVKESKNNKIPVLVIATFESFLKTKFDKFVSKIDKQKLKKFLEQN